MNPLRLHRIRIVALLVIVGVRLASAADQGKLDPHFPFRTDWANQQLPWYQPKTGEFPPHHSDHRVGGELVEADYIHRTGTFRMDGSGELMTFTMPPYSSVYHLNAEADLRDVPLGTFFLFFLNQDEEGGFTRLATMQDEFTMMANHGFAYRIAEIKAAERKIAVVKQKLGEHPEDVGHNELLLDDHARIWKGAAQIALGDLAVGDSLLVNLTGTWAQHPRRCTDIWVGADTHAQIAEQQRKRHVAFLKERGLPAWIDQVDGRKLTVTLFSSEPASLRGLFKDEGIDPAQWAKEHKHIEVVVANEHLRSYWPEVVKRGATVREYSTVPTDYYGCSGVRWVIEVDELLEGFRVGRNLRLFVHPSWPIKDMPFGEGLHEGGHDIDEPPEAREVIAADFPYRTDFGNAQLPWYRLQPAVFPPDHSEHRVMGELVELGADQRSASFRLARGAAPVHLTLAPYAPVLLHGAEAGLDELAIGSRCHLWLHQDAQGAFTVASQIIDECSWMAGNTASYRLEAARLDENRLFVAHQVEPVKVDYQLEPKHPPDFGRTELLVDAHTKVWKGDAEVGLAALAAGDVLMVDLAGEGRCSDIWVGADTAKALAEKQRQRHRAALKQGGLPGWIDHIDGKRLTIAFFSGQHGEVQAVLGGEPWGKGVFVAPADEQLHLTGAPEKLGFADRRPNNDPSVATGDSAVRWMVETQTPEHYHIGQVVRLLKEDWPLPAAK